MPHTRSARKRLRQNQERRLRNRAIKKEIKTHIKNLQAAVQSGNADQLQAQFLVTIRKLDKAAAKGVVHRNLAARKKSQLAKLISKHPAAKTPA
jgi:small subunit ribosomal protein S20